MAGCEIIFKPQTNKGFSFTVHKEFFQINNLKNKNEMRSLKKKKSNFKTGETEGSQTPGGTAGQDASSSHSTLQSHSPVKQGS